MHVRIDEPRCDYVARRIKTPRRNPPSPYFGGRAYINDLIAGNGDRDTVSDTD